MKRLIPFLLAVCLVLPLSGQQAGAAYTDVAGHWAEDAINYWSESQIVEGDNGLFRPDDPLTRGELAVVLDRLLGLSAETENTFADLDDSWYTDAILRCVAAGILVGDGQTIRPRDNIPRQECMLTLFRALEIVPVADASLSEYSDAAEVADWAREAVTALVSLGMVSGVTTTRLAPDAPISRAALLTILYRNAAAERTDPSDVTAHFSGATTASEWDVNENGLTFSIEVTPGYTFASDLTQYRAQLIDGLSFYGVQFNKTTQAYEPIPQEDFITQCLDKYDGTSYFAYVDVANAVTTYDRYVGLGSPGGRSGVEKITDELKARYPGVKEGILQALRDEATTFTARGNVLTVHCPADTLNAQFPDKIRDATETRGFSNAVEVCNGGIPIASCDVLLSATLPAGVVRGVDTPITLEDDYFTIQEMKLRAEIWEYVDAGRAGEDGVFAFQSNIDGDDRNVTGGAYGTTYYVKHVADDVLTEEDIRVGGTAGPNAVGRKLVKLVVEVRVGPTQWASSKNSVTFITNLFRTTADATGYGGGNDDIYTPADDPMWKLVETQIATDTRVADEYSLVNLKHVVNYSGDNRYDTANPAPMWMFIELPTTKKFNIDADMPVYVNFIAGMKGGSGQSNTGGMPIIGMDGRFQFVIQATDDSDLNVVN
ncbi:MAG: S-layer homology domain-containing protein [Oscillospiraceae bacterium]|nr:S-layer homology domain-containing protein [Oscillospiraceae bacterium]